MTARSDTACRARGIGPRTSALLAPSGSGLSDDARARLRSRLVADVHAVSVDLPRGGAPAAVDLAQLATARIDPARLAVEPPPFAWCPAFVRRSLGTAVLQACLDGRSGHPAEALAPVLDRALESWRRTGERVFHWEPWVAGLPAGARSVVAAEALTWATEVWAAVDWSRCPVTPRVVRARGRWVVPERPAVQLRARPDVVVPLAVGAPTAPAPAALLWTGAGSPESAATADLAHLALVAALRHPERPAPARIVAVWPECGEHRVLEVDEALLAGAVDAVVTTVRACVAARRADASGTDLTSPPPRPVGGWRGGQSPWPTTPGAPVARTGSSGVPTTPVGEVQAA